MQGRKKKKAWQVQGWCFEEEKQEKERLRRGVVAVVRVGGKEREREREGEGVDCRGKRVFLILFLL